MPCRRHDERPLIEGAILAWLSSSNRYSTAKIDTEHMVAVCQVSSNHRSTDSICELIIDLARDYALITKEKRDVPVDSEDYSLDLK